MHVMMCYCLARDAGVTTCDADAKDYELTDSSLNSLGYQLEETPDIMTNVVQVVRATSPKERKGNLSSPEEASKQLESRKM